MPQALEGEHSRAARTESVDGYAHQSAIDIIGALEQQEKKYERRNDENSGRSSNNYRMERAPNNG